MTQFVQYFMTRAYQVDEISRVAGVKYVGVIYALGIGYVFFDETFQLIWFLGMGLVLIGIFLNLWYKQRKDPVKI